MLVTCVQLLQKNVLKEEEHLQQEGNRPIMSALYPVGDGTQVEGREHRQRGGNTGGGEGTQVEGTQVEGREHRQRGGNTGRGEGTQVEGRENRWTGGNTGEGEGTQAEGGNTGGREGT